MGKRVRVHDDVGIFYHVVFVGVPGLKQTSLNPTNVHTCISTTTDGRNLARREALNNCKFHHRASIGWCKISFINNIVTPLTLP